MKFGRRIAEAAISTTMAIAVCAPVLPVAHSWADETPAAAEATEAPQAEPESSTASSQPEEPVPTPSASESSSSTTQSESKPAASTSSKKAESKAATTDSEAETKKAEEEAKAKEEAEKEAEKKAEQEKKKAEADEKIAIAEQAEGNAAYSASVLPDLIYALTEARGAFDEALASIGVTDQQVMGIENQQQTLADSAAQAQTLIDQANADMHKGTPNGSVTLKEVLSGEQDLADAESYSYLMGKIIDNRQAAVDETNAQWRELEDQKTAIKADAANQYAAADQAASACDEAAFAVEKGCAEVRQFDKDAIDAIAELDDEVEGVIEAKAAAQDSKSANNYYREQAQDAAAQWYTIAKQRAGDEAALSFSSKVSFAQSEEEFVSKWGAAIDAFYADYSATIATTAPLQGHGQDMARSAYRHHIDPRMCAAISIAESSGGLYCIRPHNAWGWGAVDSDPYNQAYQWASWEEAIEAWHTGVDESSTGLADASCLSRFGDIYCSTPIWSKNVAGYMQQIESHL